MKIIGSIDSNGNAWPLGSISGRFELPAGTKLLIDDGEYKHVISTEKDPTKLWAEIHYLQAKLKVLWSEIHSSRAKLKGLE